MADNDTSSDLAGFDPAQAAQAMQSAQQADLHANAMHNFGVQPDGKPAPDAKQPRPWNLGTWAAALPQNIGTGMIDAAVNMADTTRSLHGWLEHQGEHLHNQVVAKVTGEPAQPDQRPELDKEENVPSDPHTMTYQTGRDLALKLRDVIAVQDPNWQDKMTQSAAQFVVPMVGWTRGIGALEGVAKFTMNKVLKTAAADALTAATVIPPHESRLADMLSLGKHVESKYIDAFNTIAPDGSLLNGYINYMTDRGDESEAEGRFKNVVDQFTMGGVLAPFMHVGAKILKGGLDGLAYAMDNGVGSTGDLLKGRKYQTGAVGDLKGVDNVVNATPDFLEGRSSKSIQEMIDRKRQDYELAQPSWNSKTQSYKDYLDESMSRMHDHIEDTRPLNEAYNNAKLAEDKSSNKGKLKEIFDGYNKIPEGTSVTAVHGTQYADPTRGKVVGTKSMQLDSGFYNLPRVDFGDGKPRTVLPGDVHEVFRPTGVKEK